MNPPTKTGLAELKKLAEDTRRQAYNPYSHFAVGASIRTSDGSVYSGCNVENSSFGVTICAERVAIFKAVSDGILPKSKVTEVYVVTETSPPCAPCGSCRQVIAEFSSSDCLIHVANQTGELKTYLFKELLPDAFTPQHLRDARK